jgi:hypothetical protein
VVTNRHVVNAGNHVVRMNTKDGRATAVVSDPAEWIVSAEDDVAVLPFAIPDNADFSAIAPDLFLAEDCLIEGWQLFPGDEVIFYGRFVTHDGRQRNKPVVRYGNVAMMPDPADPVRVGDDDQEAFLVECRSLSGFSGSPAFVRLAGSRLMARADDQRGWIPTGVRFLGMDCGHLPFWSPVRPEKSQNSRLADMWVETNTGIAVVVPAWRLLALLNSPRAAQHREHCDRAVDDGLEAE